MFPNLFSSSPAVWAGLIGAMIALPILIHLINMLRHRRVKWAAMEFLLQSHKKQRNWVRLKQLLLLLARITALLLALLMLAQVGCDDPRLTGLLGGQTTHHYILLDDSYSMGELRAGATAFDRAREAIGTLGARLTRRENQRVSLLRFSQAAARQGVAEADLALEQLTDINGQRVDSQFTEMLEERRNALEPSTLSRQPQDALQVALQLIEQREGEKAVVYLLSDFRDSTWDNPTQLLPLLEQLRELNAEVEFLRCATESQSNLTLTRLAPLGSIRSAGVPVMMEVEVQNFGDQPARNLTLRCFTQPFSTLDMASGQPGTEVQESELPTVFIEEIPAGKSETRQFPVYFDAPGRHGIRVQLPDDSLMLDNQRYAVLDINQATQALIIDDSSGNDAFYLSTAFRPGRSSSGVVPLVRSPDELRDLPPEQLAAFDTVYLLGTTNLDPITVEKLEAFVSAGGGLAFFVNPNTDLNAFNQLFYKAGAGLSPLPLARLEDLPIGDGSLPDVVPTDHPLLEPFRDANDSFLNRIQISRFAVPPLSWVSDHPQADVIAEARGDAIWPLVVEQRFGTEPQTQGRVMVVTTSAGPAWNNWQRNPSFLVMLLRMQERLASGRYLGEERLVGQGITVELPHDQYRADVQFETPTPDPTLVDVVERTATRRDDAEQAPWVTRLGPGGDQAMGWQETAIPGLYTAWTRTVQGDSQVFRWSLNVDPAEGDLRLLSRRGLIETLGDREIGVLDWNELDPNPQRQASTQLSRWLFPLLIGLLLGEQALAYLASYHPVRGGARS